MFFGLLKFILFSPNSRQIQLGHKILKDTPRKVNSQEVGTPVRMAALKRQQHVLERMWKKGTLAHCWWECKLMPPL